MTDAEREEKNGLIDVLFDQIDRLEGKDAGSASTALLNWRMAKLCQHLGLGPMDARHLYRRAYDTLRDLGLEVGGMIEPYGSSDV